jgi:hypothetical protein
MRIVRCTARYIQSRALEADKTGDLLDDRPLQVTVTISAQNSFSAC